MRLQDKRRLLSSRKKTSTPSPRPQLQECVHAEHSQTNVDSLERVWKKVIKMMRSRKAAPGEQQGKDDEAEVIKSIELKTQEKLNEGFQIY